MNINIFKNLCANAYKPNGIEKFLNGDWWHHVLTDGVGSTSRLPIFHPMVVKSTSTKNNHKYRRKKYDK
jgi:hypothetical protein